MGNTIDLDAYLARIGYEGPLDPSLATLAKLHELHPRAIPFENLSPFAGVTPALDPASLEEKLVRDGRGGWCFEQNLLFALALEAIGFQVTRLAARVRMGVSAGVTRPRSHCLLRVPLEGADYIADVGFGGLTLTGPLRMASEGEQSTPHEPHRVTGIGQGVRLVEAKVAGDWVPLYSFEPHEQQVADYEVSNWYLSHHPDSHFVKSLAIARALPGERHAIRQTRYSIHRAGRESERRFAASAAELLEWLEGPFAIRVPRSGELEEKLARLVATSPREA